MQKKLSKNSAPFPPSIIAAEGLEILQGFAVRFQGIAVFLRLESLLKASESVHVCHMFLDSGSKATKNVQKKNVHCWWLFVRKCLQTCVKDSQISARNDLPWPWYLHCPGSSRSWRRCTCTVSGHHIAAALDSCSWPPQRARSAQMNSDLILGVLNPYRFWKSTTWCQNPPKLGIQIPEANHARHSTGLSFPVYLVKTKEEGCLRFNFIYSLTI